MAKKSKHKGRGPAPRPVAQAPAAGAAVGDASATPHDDTHARADVVDTVDMVDTTASGDAQAPAQAGDAAPVEAASDVGPAFAAMPAPAFDSGPVDVVDSGVGNPDDIRGVLIQLAKARLLLPNATIAEVLSYAEPDAIADAPAWLLGRIRWRGWQLPLIAFSQLAGISDERGGLGSKVVVLKALGGGKMPYFAVLTQGFPRLVTVSRGALVVDEAAADLPGILMARVTLNQDDAYLPDLARVEQLIGEALSQAA